jgi:prepilin-type N-terminal cleavage/methylation domain-containing protein
LLSPVGMVGISKPAVTARLVAQAGYSAIEMMMTVGIMGIVASMAVIQIGQSQPALKGDGGLRLVMSQLNTARELAITQRRYMRVTFTNPNQLQIIREEAPGPATTVISSVLIEGGVTFGLIAGLPDTPDAFGRNAAVDFGSATQLKFGPDGTFVNQVGQSLNGSVFVALPNLPLSARAVTVLGSTGRVRGYKWDGAHWNLA